MLACGEASDDEKKELLAMLKDMAAQSPPKGSEESWKKLNGALVEAAEGIVEGKDGAVDALKKELAKQGRAQRIGS